MVSIATRDAAADLSPHRGRKADAREGKMSKYYAAISALIFAVVAIGHLIRLLKRWTVQIGPFSVPGSVSWVGLIIAALISIWGFMQLGP
jgi:hypothetical protein